MTPDTENPYAAPEQPSEPPGEFPVRGTLLLCAGFGLGLSVVNIHEAYIHDFKFGVGLHLTMLAFILASQIGVLFSDGR